MAEKPENHAKFEHLFTEMNPSTRAKYLRCWNDFAAFANLGENVTPQEEDFMAYFRYKRVKDGFTSSTLWNFFSCLNKVYQALYKRKLQVCYSNLMNFHAKTLFVQAIRDHL